MLESRRHIPVLASVPARAGLATPWVAAVAAVLLLFLVVVTVYIDGFQAEFAKFEFWKRNSEQPLLVAFCLVTHWFLNRSGSKALEAARPIVNVDDATFFAIVSRVSASTLRSEWLALGVGALAGVLFFGVLEWPGGFNWNSLVIKITTIILFAFIGSVIWAAISWNRLFSVLYHQPLKINIFDLSPLRPVVRLGLGISLSLIGGVTLSILIVTDPKALLRPQPIALYVSLLTIAVVLFFVSLYSTHRVMAYARDRELLVVHENLAHTYEELKSRSSTGALQNMAELSEAIKAWLSYEKRILDVPDWPYTARTLRSLFGSVLLSIIITSIQQAILWR